MKVIAHTTRNYLHQLLSWSFLTPLLLVSAVAGSVFFISQASAQTDTSTETTTQYHSANAIEFCKTITPSVKNNACKDGWDDKQPCSNYQELNFDPSIAASDLVATCERAKSDKVKCLEAEKKKVTAKDVSAKCPKMTDSKDDDSEKETDPEKLQDNIDKICKEIDEDEASEEVKNICKNKTDQKPGSTQKEIEQLRKDVEALKKAAEPPLPDNQYGQYVNGANKYQPIRVNRASGDNRPAIILFHGGGWTSDDGAADKFAPHANERGYTTFVATYRLGQSGVYFQLDDALRAIQHVRNNAGMYGIDPNRIALWGDSAGGSLAVRAASSGKTGAKVQVGWSAPTNAYTALFHSPRAFAAGMSHSTCAPTDLAEINNTLTEINTGEPGTSPSTQSTGNIALDVLNIATQAQETSQSIEEISKKIEDEEGQKELSGNVRRLAAKKFIECIDNFNTTSPALFAKPGSPPGFFAGYDKDPLIHPGQAFQMRDKLRALGVPSEALILSVGDHAPNATESALGIEKDGKNHLGYHEKFVAPTLDFIDKFLHP